MYAIQNPSTSPTYRADIDGLRAIAVLSVVVYHIDHRLVPAGFLGVDIFFVLSGFLISSLIMNEIQMGTFSLVEFYRRRIKRIMPAMLLVLATTVLAAQWLFRPEEAETTARAGFWSLLSLANLFFWLFEDTSYFAADSNELPLLHLWSLGVEEQFYILWPLLLMLTYSALKRAYFGLLVLGALASFAFGEWYFSRDASFVYFMLPSRAGELLVGAIAAHYVMSGRTLSSSTAVVCAWVGVALIAGSLWWVTTQRPFPGWQAVPPTLGTALLILAGHRHSPLPNRVLSIAPLVWIGLVSYSAYLWHWPLLAFLHYGGFNLSLALGVAVFVLTFTLAWLSYRFVEQPLRRSSDSFIPLALKQFVVPSLLISILIGVSMKTDGYGLRSDTYRQALAEQRAERPGVLEYDYVCQRQRLSVADLTDERCVLGANGDTEPNALLWGDSIAARYVGMLGVFAREANFRFRNLEVGSCPPLLSGSAPYTNVRRVADCDASNHLVSNALNANTTVFASASWVHYHFNGNDVVEGFAQTLGDLASRVERVIILGHGPIAYGYDTLCREKQLGFAGVACSEAPVPLDRRIIDTNTRLQQLAARYPNVDYFDANAYLCPGDVCPLYVKDEPVFFDPYHLTIAASWRIGEEIVKREGVPQVFEQIGK
ncbi:MAG: acyltransferase family protein [Pseudomonadota bacterium]